MENQRLSDEELALLEALEEPTEKELKENPERALETKDVTLSDIPSYIERVKKLCERSTKLYRDLNEYKVRKKWIVFEVSTPVTLACKGNVSLSNSTINFIGMEKLTLQRFVPTDKGDIVFVFSYDEFDGDIYVKMNDMEKIFLGKTNELSLRKVMAHTSVQKELEDIIEDETRKMKHMAYSDNKFGRW